MPAPTNKVDITEGMIIPTDNDLLSIRLLTDCYLGKCGTRAEHNALLRIRNQLKCYRTASSPTFTLISALSRNCGSEVNFILPK